MKIIEDGNKIIANFMIRQKPQKHFCVSSMDKEGYDVFVSGETSYYPINKLKFHSSFNWLIPVCDKIVAIGINELRVSVEFENAKDDNNIDRLWCAVVEFIEWYNKQTSVKQ